MTEEERAAIIARYNHEYRAVSLHHAVASSRDVPVLMREVYRLLTLLEQAEAPQ